MKILVTDVDGTLTDADKKVVPESIEAIQLARKNDFRVFIASGNPYPVTWTLSFFLGARDWVIAESGCVIGKGWRQQHILGTREIIKAGMELLKKVFPIEVYESPTNAFRLVDLAFYSELPLDQLQEVLEREGLPLEIKDSGFAKHVVFKGVNKATALQEILERDVNLQGDDDTLIAVVGDGNNDLDLFTSPFVTIRGTISNATDLIKKEADYVSNHPFGKGVLDFVKKLTSNRL